MDDDREVIFRQIDAPRPGNRFGGMYWYVEFHSDIHDMGFPLGIAFVLAHPKMRETLGFSAMLDFIFVCDQHRRQGIATRLIETCRERWPDIELGEAIDDAGRKFLASVE